MKVVAKWEAVDASRGMTKLGRTGGGQDCWNKFTPLGGTLLRAVGTGGKGGQRTYREITHVSCALKTTGWHSRRYTRFLVQTENTQLHADVCLLLRTPLLAFNYSYIVVAP